MGFSDCFGVRVSIFVSRESVAVVLSGSTDFNLFSLMHELNKQNKIDSGSINTKTRFFIAFMGKWLDFVLTLLPGDSFAPTSEDNSLR